MLEWIEVGRNALWQVNSYGEAQEMDIHSEMDSDRHKLQR